MSVEHQPSQPESAERASELEAIAAEKQAERESAPENLAEHAERQDNAAEAARKVIDEQTREPEPVPVPEATDPKPSFTARISQALSYHETMASVQTKLSPVSRSFSRVIHAPAVEKTSEALETTLMRPSVALGAVITAVIVGGIFYYFAHRYGYAMRGSELLASLVVGGVLGLAVEGLVRFTHRSHR